MVFERSLLFVTRSVEQNRQLVTRVYFPRLILPVAAWRSGLLYLAVLLVVLSSPCSLPPARRRLVRHAAAAAARSVAAIVVSLLFAIAVGLWTSVLQARYRDVRYGFAM